MVQRTNFSGILLACISLCLLNAGSVNTVNAAQTTTAALQSGAGKIYGKVTDVITTDSFTYVEVETVKDKVWAAGPATTISKGSMISFSTKTPMQNFHSKSLGRDFSIIYFVSGFITDKDNSATTEPQDQIKQQSGKIITSIIPDTSGEVDVGGYLREASLDGLNATKKSFSDYKGKPLIINIWASWCGPCRAEMGSLDRLAQRYNGKEFNIIGISTDDYRDKAEDFIKESGVSFENFLDHKLILENMLGASMIPLTILVDADGRVLQKVSGAREWDSQVIVGAIAEVFHIKLMN
jgi:thiol-disulfide isomerase/thioredoxin